MINADIVWLRDDPALVLDNFAAQLDAKEQAQLANYSHPERQRSFILSRTLLRHVLASRLGMSKSSLVFSRAENGRLTHRHDSGWQFSLSHAAGLIAVIVAEADCGVDIEVRRSIPFERITRRYFSDAENAWLAQCDGDLREQEFFRLWTLKEAAVKALHEGLANNLSRLAFDLSPAHPRLLDTSSGLQVFQQVAADIFLAGAVRTSRGISWSVSSLHPDDL